MRVVFLFLLICLCAVVILGNHDRDAKKRHNAHDHDKRHHQVKHGVHKKSQGHQRSHGHNGHDHDKRHHQVKHGVLKKSQDHQRTHGHKERHHGIHEKHPEQTRHGHGYHVAKKSHAGHLDHNNKHHHNLHHGDHAKRLARNETTTETPVSIVTAILGDSTSLPVDFQSTSTASDISSTIGDTTDDSEEDPDDDDDGEDDGNADTTTEGSTTPQPSHGILLPIPQFFWPPPINHWIENATKDINDRYNCIRRLTANITYTIRANLRRNPQAARNISLTINGRVVYNVTVQVGVTCPSFDDDQDSTLSLGIISEALHQSSCFNSITRNITCEILRGISSNLARPQHIILIIDNQVVYDITLDLSQRLCTKPGSEQRATLLHYLIGFPTNINGAYPIKRSGLNEVAKRVYDRLNSTNENTD